MTLRLIKKDFLLAKKFILIIMGLVIVLPLFVALSMPESAGVTSFLFTTIFSEMILIQYISMAELKYPKAETLLCSSPYSRRDIVIAKYLFYLLVFAYCFVSYWIMALILPGRVAFSLDIILLTLLIVSVVYGIYMPMQFKFGVEKTKYAFMVILFGVSFGTPVVTGWAQRINFSFWETIPPIALRAGAAAITVLILAVSAWASVKIYAKKEL